ncbi:ankyrin repeat domain-containing protein [Endozoicomonas sp. SCSIO W0465]|uniref:ankyrin repeat domain-containing protein n=1 Tax=Endozoicomonas sp. SCSIO W0465 TaxID=2918516 RepID=UPI002074D868|nr:ankyrin repeat domain-containing protein [Endozoicomonas sp. SCSIO W0465]USE35504.1 ankyrin repeat domain-containing protein [Endozoicomonas sp. SCSIO W0465]
MKAYNDNYFPLNIAESYESLDSNHSVTPSFDYRKVSEASNQSSNSLIPASQTTWPTATQNAKSVTTRCARKNTHEENLQIMEAIKKGNFEELEKFHEAGLTITATINITFPFLFDPFFHAAMNNNKELFKFMIEKAGTPEAIDDFGQLVLMLIENDQLEFIELLEQFNWLSDSYAIDIHDRLRCIPMINIAIITDSPKTIAWLLDKKIDPTIKARL